jgi:hypothetical protein
VAFAGNIHDSFFCLTRLIEPWLHGPYEHISGLEDAREKVEGLRKGLSAQ